MNWIQGYNTGRCLGLGRVMRPPAKHKNINSSCSSLWKAPCATVSVVGNQCGMKLIAKRNKLPQSLLGQGSSLPSWPVPFETPLHRRQNATPLHGPWLPCLHLHSLPGGRTQGAASQRSLTWATASSPPELLVQRQNWN